MLQPHAYRGRSYTKYLLLTCLLTHATPYIRFRTPSSFCGEPYGWDVMLARPNYLNYSLTSL